MTSSEVGLGILKNWQRKKTLLWLVTIERGSHDVLIRYVDASRLDLFDVGSEETFSWPLLGAKFREANPDEEPPPFVGMVGDTFSLFLFLELKNGRLFVFGERRPVC